MDEPTPVDQRVPPYVALVRIAAVVGMSIFAAFGLFMLVGGFWINGLIFLLLATPFFFIMRLVEGTVGTTNEKDAATKSS